MADRPPQLYVPLAVDIHDDPDIQAVGMMGFALYASGLAWAKAHAKDGEIPASCLSRLLIAPTPESLAELPDLAQRLVDVGLWITTPGGFRARSWDKWNIGDIERDRWRENKRKQRARGGVPAMSPPMSPPVSKSPGAEVEVEVEEVQNPGDQTHVPGRPIVDNSTRPTPDDRTVYLLSRIVEADPSWEALGWAGIQKLINDHGLAIVNTALGYIREAPPAEPVSSPFAYLRAAIKQAQSLQEVPA